MGCRQTSAWYCGSFIVICWFSFTIPPVLYLLVFSIWLITNPRNCRQRRRDSGCYWWEWKFGSYLGHFRSFVPRSFAPPRAYFCSKRSSVLPLGTFAFGSGSRKQWSTYSVLACVFRAVIVPIFHRRPDFLYSLVSIPKGTCGNFWFSAQRSVGWRLFVS